MPNLTCILAAAVIALGAAGCGSSAEPREQSPVATADIRERAIEREFDGLYGAELPTHMLRAALSELKPPVSYHGGWWSLLVDVEARRINLRHSEGDNVELRIASVGDDHIELAPDTACEQRGAGRTESARLNWTRSGPYLRFHAVHVPCLSDKVLLTLTAWQEA